MVGSIQLFLNEAELSLLLTKISAREIFHARPIFLLILEVEGIRIGQLSHSEPYNASKDCNEDVDENADDDYILRKLFKKSGIFLRLKLLVQTGKHTSFYLASR